MILASQGNEMDFQKNAGFDEMPRIRTLHLFFINQIVLILSSKQSDDITIIF
jgi:hypothetical protein